MAKPELTPKLERALKEAYQLDVFIATYELISERRFDAKLDIKYAQCILDFLELGLRADLMRKKYVTIGGLAIMSHLYKDDPDSILSWRGTNDIDILSKRSGLEPILKNLDYILNIDSRQHPGIIGALYNYTKQNVASEKLVVVGLRGGVELNGKDVTDALYERREIMPFFGIPISVAGIGDMLDMKRYACLGGRNKSKDRLDILALQQLK